MYPSQQEAEGGLFETGQYEFPQEMGGQGYVSLESPLSEAQEMEAAAHVLEARDAAELESTIQGFLPIFAKIAGKVLSNPGVRNVLGKAVTQIGKKVLPNLGNILGGLFGETEYEQQEQFLPALGGIVSQIAGSLLGGEFEAQNAEDREFDAAQRLVRLAAGAAQQAASAPATADPQTVAKNALIAAARQQIPGFASAMPGAAGMTAQPRRAGRWIRRGNKIIVMGA